MSLFNLGGNKSTTSTNNPPSLFGNQTSTSSTNNPPSLFGNQKSTAPSLFQIPNNQTSTNVFGTSTQNNTAGSFLGNNNSQNNQSQNTASFFTQNNVQGNQNQNNNNPNNQNILQQQNNNINQSYLNLNDPKIQHDLIEYQEALKNVEKCLKVTEKENMFKDYIYLPIPKGYSPSQYHIYQPYTRMNNNVSIINDYNIWEEGNKKNKNPNEFFTAQISSVDALINKNRSLEKSILENIAKSVDNEKILENLNKKIDEEMNTKILNIKECHLKVDELEIDLSSKIAQYNYLVGAAQENVGKTQEIKENIKKTNDNINKNKILEISEKIKQASNENFKGENKNYIKDMSKEKINGMLDGLVEIQNMMKIIYDNNKKNYNILLGIEKEADKILNEI